ncbi:MAG: hypothetical protein QOJ71_2414 [Actinomycetota bacterium]|jgi:uncharacterized protein YndB with AHSA1/START domain|nr:hypothetical protein [Actinomycetota bacterium]
MTHAILQSAGERPVLRFERHLPRPVEDVWIAVTDPEAMRSWFPTRIVIDEWRVGATLSHVFEDSDIAPLPGTVLEWEPQHRVAFTWGTDTITFELRAEGAGTNFILTEELGANIAARNAAGWEICLQRLETGASSDAWTSHFDHYVSVFQPILGPQDGPPDGYQDSNA